MLSRFICLCSTILCLSNLNAQENYNLVVRSNLPFPGLSLANIGGYVDSSGNEYALVGTSRGLTIVNVSNPEQPFVRFTINGVQNSWREVKTWNGFAYVTSEGANSGLTIIDMRELPDTILTKVYRGDGAINNQLSSNHALHIDDGFCYLYGSNAFAPPNLNNGGVIALNLADPWNPRYAGKFSEIYVHDGFVHNDTVWSCNVYDGFFTAIDFRNKANPVSIAQQETPGGVTHNSWLTDDRRTLLVTDESTNSFLTSWDITDLSNITELDRYQTAPGTNSIVHNTHILNNFAVTSWYTEGVVIVDAARPQNLVEVAKNDFTSFEGDGFKGCWGVYPFLPSGNLVASDMERGLYVLTPTYVRASYLEGIVRDSTCGGLLDLVTVQIVGTDRSDRTGLDGIFRTGTAAPGTYDVTFSRNGYPSKTLKNIVLQSGQVTELEVDLFSPDNIAVTGTVESLANDPVSNAQVNLSSNSNNYLFNTNTNGQFNKCNLIPGNYDFTAGKWGFVTDCEEINVSGASVLVKSLETGYYDDFQFNFGWETIGAATVGKWVRAKPFGTTFNGNASNPSADVPGDCNTLAFVTGNAANSSAGTDDVDDGNTILRSPEMDLSSYADPYLHVYRWFYNGGGANPLLNDANDTLFLKLQQGNEIVILKKIAKNSGMSSWIKETFRIRDYIANPGTLRFIAEAEDFEPGHLVEAGIDLFSIADSGTTVFTENQANIFKAVILPNPSTGEAFILFDKIQAQLLLSISDISGKLIHEKSLNTNDTLFALPGYLPAGIYFLRMMNQQGQTNTLRWIKQ
jgi:choice-of-anchor B domain-containing protein